MKVLFDPIYSAQPARCSSAYKFRRIALQLLEARTDLFIYWPIPTWIDEDSRNWLPKSDRIQYVPYPSSKDRVREYQLLYRELENLLAFNGTHWDFDVLITMRTQQVPSMKTLMSSPRLKRYPALKKILVLEEMAVFGFRKTVPVTGPLAQDLLTAAGYLIADRSYITAAHVRQGAINAARAIYSPSHVKTISERLRLVSPASLKEYETKPPEFRFKRGSQPFCLGFCGRMSNSMTRLPEIYDLMDKHWILKGDAGFKVIISTVTEVIKLPPPEFCVIEHNSREKFWARVKEDMHLVISLSIDAEFALSLVEPLMLGTPLVIAREPWTEGLFGKDYPFFSDNTAQAYGIVKAFHDNYESCYQEFLTWRDASFKPRFEPGGPYAISLYDDIVTETLAWDVDVLNRYRSDYPQLGDNEVVRLLAGKANALGELSMVEAAQELVDSGVMSEFAAHLRENAREKRTLTFSAVWPNYRVGLLAFHGFKDASLKLGHLVRGV